MKSQRDSTHGSWRHARTRTTHQCPAALAAHTTGDGAIAIATDYRAKRADVLSCRWSQFGGAAQMIVDVLPGLGLTTETTRAFGAIRALKMSTMRSSPMQLFYLRAVTTLSQISSYHIYLCGSVNA